MIEQKQRMVSLQTLLERNENKSGTPSVTSEILTGKRSDLAHETKVLINMIFARFHHIYTHRFESAYGDETTLNQAKREWALTLNGIPGNLIELALERCKREHAWPPTIAEFLKLVQPTPESLGLPSTDAAYSEASRRCHMPKSHQWSHICVQLAAQSVGLFSLRSDPESKTRPKFNAAYLKLIERLTQGEQFEVAEVPALPEPSFDASIKLTAKLLAKGLSEQNAQQIAYYLDKPQGSPVRERYRERSLIQLKELQITLKLPE